MSGPKTTHYQISAQALASAQREAQRRREERLRRLRVAVDACEQLERSISELRERVFALRQEYPAETIAIDIPSRSRPSSNEPEDLEQYGAALQSALNEASKSLSTISKQAKTNKEFREAIRGAIGAASNAPKAMIDLVPPTTKALSGANLLEAQARRDRLSRILGRLSNEATTAVHSDLRALAQEIVGSVSKERASALEDELRLRVQQHNKAVQKKANDRGTAQKLLVQLDNSGEVSNSTLRGQVEQVACGLCPLTPALIGEVERQVKENTSRAAELAKREAAMIVAKALADLGYAVEPISETLFVQGGTVHFQRADWGEYFVRMRVRPDADEMNFNVVRTDTGESGSSERRKSKDVAAETTWCREFGKVREVLRTRGFDTNLTREIPIGAVPAQVVSKAAVENVPVATASRQGRAGTGKANKATREY